MRFWGADIYKNLDKCVEDVKEEIFQKRIKEKELEIDGVEIEKGDSCEHSVSD